MFVCEYVYVCLCVNMCICVCMHACLCVCVWIGGGGGVPIYATILASNPFLTVFVIDHSRIHVPQCESNIFAKLWLGKVLCTFRAFSWKSFLYTYCTSAHHWVTRPSGHQTQAAWNLPCVSISTVAIAWLPC